MIKTNHFNYKMDSYKMMLEMNQQCIDLIFNNIIDGFEEGWTLFEQILVNIPNINGLLTGGKFKGETYLRAACKSGNHRMVKLLIADQHGLLLEEETVAIYIDDHSKRWIKNHLDIANLQIN